MADRRLILLEAWRPTWFQIARSENDHVAGSARVDETIWREAGIDLRIRAGKLIEVGEDVPESCLPKNCAERHIQADSTFCLGLRPIEVHDQASAAAWWEALRQYLWLQSVAGRTGVWADKHYLDHGLAGFYHEAALAEADRLSLRSEYDAAYDGEPSWITDRRLHLADGEGNPINGRAACPRACKCTRRSVPKLRRDCPKREGIARLSHLEGMRRNELDQYWQEQRARGVVCCGTMRSCPLRSG